MSDGSGEQQQLTEVPSEAESETLQEKVIRLYNSPKLHENAIGYWMKVLYEGSIAGGGLIILFLLPASGLSYLNVIPVSLIHVVGLWCTFTVSIFYATWCFSEPATSEKTEGEAED